MAFFSESNPLTIVDSMVFAPTQGPASGGKFSPQKISTSSASHNGLISKMGFLYGELTVLFGALQVPICLLLLVASGGDFWDQPKIDPNKIDHLLGGRRR